MFKNYLLKTGVPKDHIIKIELDKITNKKFHHNPLAFDKYIRSFFKDKKNYYLILDEIQLVEEFELILTGLFYEKNVDIYVTGINSKFLS
ncbi:AAA family ATPase [Treponema pedis]|uniref:AAA family ATPase n=1 Tax=Treponema pedis TaxID=409322 RepID=UPI003D1A167A